MAVEVTRTTKAYLKLPDGATSTGGAKYATVSIGTLNPETFDKDKFFAIGEKLKRVLDTNPEGYYYVQTKQVAAA